MDDSMRNRYTEEQIISFLQEADKGYSVADLCQKYGFSEASYYNWKSKYGGMALSEAKRLKPLEAENTQLKKLLAESLLDNTALKDIVSRKW